MKTIQGLITSLKTEKTAQVAVSRLWQHPLYKKSVKRTNTYACHYENIELAVGDSVVIQESKPISKTKSFIVVSKVERSQS